MNRIAMVKWSSRSRARERRLPAGFVETCQPVLCDTVPVGPGWLHELKYDGWRIIARKSGERVQLWSRNAHDWAGTFTAITAAVRVLPFDEVVLDGEAVVHGADGLPDFWALRTDSAQTAVLYAFDLLFLGSDDLRSRTLVERRRLLDQVLSVSSEGLRESEVYAGDGRDLLLHACALGLEGIVSKRKDSRYRSGPFDGWRKIKCADYRRRASV